MSKPPVSVDLDCEAALEAARAKGRLRRPATPRMNAARVISPLAAQALSPQ